MSNGKAKTKTWLKDWKELRNKTYGGLFRFLNPKWYINCLLGFGVEKFQSDALSEEIECARVVVAGSGASTGRVLARTGGYKPTTPAAPIESQAHPDVQPPVPEPAVDAQQQIANEMSYDSKNVLVPV